MGVTKENARETEIETQKEMETGKMRRQIDIAKETKRRKKINVAFLIY